MSRAPEAVARLGWVLDGQIRFDEHRGPARLSAEGLVAELRLLARIEPVDEATVMAAVLLGESVDADPTNASLWGQFRAALSDLRSVGVGDADGDQISKLIAGLSAPISDPTVV